MAINLTKGQTVNLSKDKYDLSKVTIGLGWKVRQQGGSFFGKMFGTKQAEFDLDAIAFLLNEQGKVANIGVKKDIGGGRQRGLQDGDVIFYHNLRHTSGTVWHTGDERVGGAGSSDDEQIIVKLNEVPDRYHKLLFLVTIYQGHKNSQHFGMVEGAYIRAVDARGEEIARYNLDSEAAYDQKCSMLFGEVYRKDGGWKFRATGNAQTTDSFVEFLKQYV
ncbi:MAG: TerD family protein [Bacteroidota bacterium]